MIKALLAAEMFQIWPSIALVVLTSFMVGTMIWVFRPGSAELYRRAANQLLDAKGERGE